MSPYIQLGDYDGDGSVDLALQIVQKSSGKRGIVFIHTTDVSTFILGAGKKFNNLGDDFKWHKQWRKDSQALKSDKIIDSAEALIIDNPDFSKSLLFFDGKGYRSQVLDSQDYVVDLPVYGQDIPQLLLRISGLKPL